MSGLGDKLKGTFDEVAGKVTGDQQQEAKGKAEQIVGNLKERAEDVKDSVGGKVNEVLDKIKDKTEETPRDDTE